MTVCLVGDEKCADEKKKSKKVKKTQISIVYHSGPPKLNLPKLGRKNTGKIDAFFLLQNESQVCSPHCPTLTIFL